MARVTVEDCIQKVENRFDLVLLAAHRARQIASGAQLLVDRDRDKNPVVSLREIAEGELKPIDLRKASSIRCRNMSRSMSLRPRPRRSSACNPRMRPTTPSVQFDRTMTEEDLLRGLEGIVPPAETRDEEE